MQPTSNSNAAPAEPSDLIEPKFFALCPHGRMAQRPAKVSFLIRQPLEQSHRLGVNALAVHEDAQRVVTAGRDADVRVWSIEEEMALSALCVSLQSC